VTLTFDLHNRHTYSEEQMKANRASARYTAVIGALTLDNTLISRAAVPKRVQEGLGPWSSASAAAPAPVGSRRSPRPVLKPSTIAVPEQETQVSLSGREVIIDRPDGTTAYTSPGRPNRRRQQRDDRIPAPAALSSSAACRGRTSR
jgi:hypothetical protein